MRKNVTCSQSYLDSESLLVTRTRRSSKTQILVQCLTSSQIWLTPLVDDHQTACTWQNCKKKTLARVNQHTHWYHRLLSGQISVYTQQILDWTQRPSSKHEIFITLETIKLNFVVLTFYHGTSVGAGPPKACKWAYKMAFMVSSFNKCLCCPCSIRFLLLSLSLYGFVHGFVAWFFTPYLLVLATWLILPLYQVLFFLGMSFQPFGIGIVFHSPPCHHVY